MNTVPGTGADTGAVPLPAELLAAIAARGVVRQFPAGAVLVNEGDSTDSLYVLLSGRVKIYATAEDGREVLLNEYGPGEYFGELSIDGAPRSASVRAALACRCRVVQGAELRRFLAEHPDFAAHLTLKLVRLVRQLTDQVRSLALQDVYGRVVRVLMELSDPDPAPDAPAEARVLRHALTQRDIAERIGASREMVNRVMKALADGGWVERRDGRLAIRRKLPTAW